MCSPEALLGREIAKLRNRIGLSQEELGFRAEVHRTYISQLERGLKSPTLSMILKLSRALKASASKLVATVERQLLGSLDRQFPALRCAILNGSPYRCCYQSGTMYT